MKRIKSFLLGLFIKPRLILLAIGIIMGFSVCGFTILEIKWHRFGSTVATLIYIVMCIIQLTFLAYMSINIRINNENLKIKISKLSNKLTPERKEKREYAISITYFNRLKGKHAIVKNILLLSAALLFILTNIFEFNVIEFYVICLIPITLLLLIVLKDFILYYRISNGLFGTNAYEARLLIDFLIENSNSIDITDGSGGLKPVLLPEKLRPKLSEFPFGQEAQA
jgi:hypothetical protein